MRVRVCIFSFFFSSCDFCFVRRAVQCGLEVKKLLYDAVLSANVRLSVKIGIGAGMVSIVYLGGVYGRVEYLALGEPLTQAFHAEHCATKSELVVSPEAWGPIKEFFEADIEKGGHAFVHSCKTPVRKKKGKNIVDEYMSVAFTRSLKAFIPPAIVPFAAKADDKWINELRRVTVLFVNLGIREKELVRAFFLLLFCFHLPPDLDLVCRSLHTRSAFYPG